MAEKLFCTFLVDKLFFGVEVTKVQEVISYQMTTLVPLSLPVIHGLINLRGQIITTIDLRRRLEMADSAAEIVPMNVIVDINGEVVSLLVDKAEDVLHVAEDAFEPAPETLQGVARELICGAYKLKNHLLLVLDIEKTVNFV